MLTMAQSVKMKHGVVDEKMVHQGLILHARLSEIMVIFQGADEQEEVIKKLNSCHGK